MCFPSARGILAVLVVLLVGALLLEETQPVDAAYFHSKRIWLVGSSSGIGEELAYSLARRCGAECTLMLSSRRVERMRAVAERVRELNSGVRVELVPLDAANRTSLLAACDAPAVRRNVDVLIYNSGINQRGRASQQLDADAIDELVSVNFASAAHASACVLPGMIERHFGHLAFVSSLAGVRAIPGSGMYGATKAAMSYWSENLAIELRDDNVATTDVKIGFIATDMIKNLKRPMAFVKRADETADVIADGIAARKQYIGFPWQTNVATALGLVFPSRVYTALLARSDHTRAAVRDAAEKQKKAEL